MTNILYLYCFIRYWKEVYKLQKFISTLCTVIYVKKWLERNHPRSGCNYYPIIRLERVLNLRTSEGVWTDVAFCCGTEPQAYKQKPLTVKFSNTRSWMQLNLQWCVLLAFIALRTSDLCWWFAHAKCNSSSPCWRGNFSDSFVLRVVCRHLQY